MPGLQQTITSAHRLAREAGINLSPSKINKVVRRAWHENPSITDGDLARCIAYSDPTGEAAVRSIDRARRRTAPSTRAYRSPYFESLQEEVDVMAMADATDEQFEAALRVARTQGDLSRANVVRLLADIHSGRPQAAKKPRRGLPPVIAEALLNPNSDEGIKL